MIILRRLVHCFFLVLTAFSLASCAVKPQVITKAETQERVYKDWLAMFAQQEPLKRNLTVYQAMARAVKYNLEIRVKAFESAFAQVDAKASSYMMLPKLVAAAGYSGRNNSLSVTSPTAPGTVSTTEDRDQHDYSLQLGWNSLDFGLTYVESKQKANYFLISEERKRKIIQQLMSDTLDIYWRAWGAQKILPDLVWFRQEIRNAINQSEQASRRKLISPGKAAFYRSELWKTYRDINMLALQLSKAQPELLAMINAKPSTHLVLSKPNYSPRLPKNFPRKLSELQFIALQDRPELREEHYKHRISLEEVTKAQLRLFPSLEINGGFSFDSNSFLLNNDWRSIGLRLSWDIMRLIAYQAHVKVAEKGEALASMQRMALSMGVITQVAIAKLKYHQANRLVAISLKLRDSRYEYYRHLKNKHRAKLESKLAVIDAKAKWMLSRLDYYLAYADLNNAIGQMLVSVGFDPLHRVKQLDVSVDELARQISLSLHTLPGINMQRKKGKS